MVDWGRWWFFTLMSCWVVQKWSCCLINNRNCPLKTLKCVYFLSKLCHWSYRKYVWKLCTCTHIFGLCWLCAVQQKLTMVLQVDEWEDRLNVEDRCYLTVLCWVCGRLRCCMFYIRMGERFFNITQTWRSGTLITWRYPTLTMIG